MSYVRIQINHTLPLPQKELSIYLFNEIGEEHNLTEEEVFGYFIIESCILLPNHTYITIFTVSIPDLELRDIELRDVIASYLDTIKKLDCVVTVLKLQDSMLHEVCFEYYKKLFEIEMELRNVLTYILTYDDKPVDNGIFKDFGIRIAESYNFNEVTEQFENGLYYILFNHYASFSEPKALRAEDIAELLQTPNIQTFEEFRERVKRRGISEDRHTQFLFSIKEKLNPLEKMRNAIMHIRNLSPTVTTNFEKAAYDFDSEKGVHTLIKEFWVNERNIENQKTWLAMAKDQIKKLITIESGIFLMNDDYYDYEFNEYYTQIDEFKTELVSYLIDRIVVPEFDSERDEFQLAIHTLIEETLAR